MLPLARYDDGPLRRRCLLKAEAQVRKPQPARLVLATAPRAGGGGITVGATQRRAAEELLAPLQLEDLLLDRAGRDEAHDVHRVDLPHAVHAVARLVKVGVRGRVGVRLRVRLRVSRTQSPRRPVRVRVRDRDRVRVRVRGLGRSCPPGRIGRRSAR